MNLIYNKTILARILSSEHGRYFAPEAIAKSLPCRWGENCWIEGERYFVSRAKIEAATRYREYIILHRQHLESNKYDSEGVRQSIFDRDNLPKSREEYLEIAKIQVRGATESIRLERLYAITQNVHYNWLEYDGWRTNLDCDDGLPGPSYFVEAIASVGRSSSINDLFLNTETMELFQVVSIGFKRFAF